jgi:dolichol-phosphate mannosyltransferase
MPDTPAPTQGPTLSIVVPAYNERGNLSQLCAELEKVLSSLGLSWEIIFVDDGSTDNTWKDIESLHNDDPRVHGIRLSRNFGHQNALIAGLSMHGDAVISMDADLSIFRCYFPACGRAKAIIGTVRRGPEIFRLQALDIQAVLLAVLLSQRRRDPKRNGGFPVSIARCSMSSSSSRGRTVFRALSGGPSSSNVVFDCGTRFSGATKYTLKKMLRFAWHGISSFSLVPLRIGILLGLFSSGIAFIGVFYAILSKLFDGHTVPGWASSLAIISFLFGVLFVFLAILAEYMGRILEEVRGRPRFIVSERLDTTALPRCCKSHGENETMNERMMALVMSPDFRQFYRFAIIGCLNVLISFAVFVLCYEVWPWPA